MQKINSGVTAPKGFLAGGVHCGVKTNNTAKKDIAIIYSEKPCTAAAVYTQNKVFGAPITVTRRNIADGMAQAVATAAMRTPAMRTVWKRRRKCVFWQQKHCI